MKTQRSLGRTHNDRSGQVYIKKNSDSVKRLGVMYLSFQATLRLDGGRGFVLPTPAEPAKVVLCIVTIYYCIDLDYLTQGHPEVQDEILTDAAPAEAILCKLLKKEWPGQVVSRQGNMVTVQLFNKSRLVKFYFLFFSKIPEKFMCF